MSENVINNDHKRSLINVSDDQAMREESSNHSVSSSEESVSKTVYTKSVNSTESPVSEVIILAEKEAKDIKRVRILIILVLLMSAVGATSVYLYSTHLENEQFEQQFEYDGNKVGKTQVKVATQGKVFLKLLKICGILTHTWN